MRIKFYSWTAVAVALIAAGALIALGYFGLFSKKFGSFSGTEKTFAIIKPDAIKAKNCGKIIDRIEQEGFTIVQMKKTTLTKDLAEKFYVEHNGKKFFDELISFMTSGPCVVMVLEKNNAIADWRSLMGNSTTEGTLRHQFGTSITFNAVHGSDSPEAAKREIEIFFTEGK